MNKPKFPWLHKMTDAERAEYRARLLDADFAEQEREAQRQSEAEAVDELIDTDDEEGEEDNYGPINRF